MRFKLLKNTAYIAIISCALGMSGCIAYQEEGYDVYPGVHAPQPSCLDNNGMECVVISDTESALYLPSFSEQTYTVTTTEVVPEQQTYYGSQNGTDLSLSAPVVGTPLKVNVEPIKTAREVEISTVETEAVSVPVSRSDEEVQVPAPEEKSTKVQQNEEVQVKTQTVQSKTVEVEEKVTTATTIKDSSLSTKASYGEKCHDWEAKIGDTLRGLLKQWGEQAGWTVIWKLDRDYHLEAGVIFRGTFTEVSGALIRSFARATPAPIGTFYKGNRVLVISTQEDENAN